jgi:hypothetical protein
VQPLAQTPAIPSTIGDTVHVSPVVNPPFHRFSVLVNATDPDLDPDMGDGVGIKADVMVTQQTLLNAFLEEVRQSVVSKLTNSAVTWTLTANDPNSKAKPKQGAITDIRTQRDWEALRDEGQLDPDRGPELWLEILDDDQ